MARAISLLTERHQKHQQLLCLPPATGELPETGGIIVSSYASPYRKPIEHAGHLYQEKLIRLYSINNDDSQDENDGNNSESTDNSTSNSSKQQSNNEKPADAASSLASKMSIGSDDLYELLELGEKRWHATADEIKKSFRRLSLTYHPDKIAHLGEEARQNSESHFKSVMKAYDILSDKKKRAAYDSIDDVDDSIPSERDGTSSKERFYARFGECFELNARWSVSNRVPKLGDDETDMEEVHKFYDFWYSFKSWRDFSFDLEHNTDQAECREEKRWMERQNSKHVKARKLEESIRIRKLVDLSFKHDPRLQRQRAEAKAKKDKQKQEKKKLVEEKLRLEKEKIEKEKIEKEKKLVEEKEKRVLAKKQKENARQVMRKSRQKLRAISKKIGMISTERGGFIVEKMCMEGTVESIDAVCNCLSSLIDELSMAEGDSSQKLVDQALQIMERAVQNPREQLVDDNVGNCTDSSSSTITSSKDQSASSNGMTNGHTSNARKVVDSEKSASKQNVHWTADELSLLSKAVAKFPGGARDRWQKISDLIGTKTPEQVLRKVNESRVAKIGGNTNVQSGYSAKKDDAKAFERYQEKKKGSVKTSSTSPNKSSTITNTAPKTFSTSSTSPSKSQLSNGSASNGGGTKDGGGTSSQPPNKLQFTPKEQSMFEASLKKIPASEGDNRWKKVSNIVGRTPDECQQRFKELIAFFQSKNRK